MFIKKNVALLAGALIASGCGAFGYSGVRWHIAGGFAQQDAPPPRPVQTPTKTKTATTPSVRIKSIAVLRINRDIPIAMLIDAGDYGAVDPIFASNEFWDPRHGITDVWLGLACLNRPDVSDRDLVFGIIEQGWRPATLAETLWLCGMHPDLPFHYTIAARGDVRGERRFLPAIGLDNEGRRMLGKIPRRASWRRDDDPTLCFAVVGLSAALPK